MEPSGSWHTHTEEGSDDMADAGVEVELIAAVYPNTYAARVTLVDTSAGAYYGAGYQDVQNRVPKIDNTRADLGWAPNVAMEDALLRIFEAYRTHVADARRLVE